VKTTTLPEFIAELGDSEAARLFGVPERTVQSWRRRERFPRPAMASRIIDVAGGRLNMGGIYAVPADDESGAVTGYTIPVTTTAPTEKVA
jgi:hypothetical protein